MKVDLESDRWLVAGLHLGVDVSIVCLADLRGQIVVRNSPASPWQPAMLHLFEGIGRRL